MLSCQRQRFPSLLDWKLILKSCWPAKTILALWVYHLKRSQTSIVCLSLTRSFVFWFSPQHCSFSVLYFQCQLSTAGWRLLIASAYREGRLAMCLQMRWRTVDLLFCFQSSQITKITNMFMHFWDIWERLKFHPSVCGCVCYMNLIATPYPTNTINVCWWLKYYVFIKPRPLKNLCIQFSPILGLRRFWVKDSCGPHLPSVQTNHGNFRSREPCDLQDNNFFKTWSPLLASTNRNCAALRGCWWTCNTLLCMFWMDNCDLEVIRCEPQGSQAGSALLDNF